MRAALLLALVIALPARPRSEPCGEPGVEQDAAAADGLSAAEFKASANAALELARGAGSRAAFWSALGRLAELCSAAPPADARVVRAQALELLVQRETDTMRWSSLLSRQFLPAFERIPRSAWAAELAAYDELLERLAASATSERLRAELRYAKLFARVFINRRWDWLSEEARTEALEWIADIERRDADLPVPGSADPEHDTMAARARSHDHELRELYFGAPAPVTVGIDLTGTALDLGDHAGTVRVLDFWTSFCQPCLALVPGVRAMLSDFEGEPVLYFGVNGDPRREAGLATARRVGMPWRNFWDGPTAPEGPIARAWNVPALGWPSVYVIDQRGRIRFKLRGQRQVEAELEQAIRTLLAE